MLTDPATHARLRVGVLLDGLIQPAWIDAAITEICASEQLELALVVLDASTSHAPERLLKHRSIVGKAVHWASNWRQAPYWAYLNIEKRLWPPSEDPFQPVDLSQKLAGIPTIRVNTIRKKFSDWFPDDAVEAILSHRLDVAHRFGFRILKGRSLEIARHGVWSFHHGDYLAYRGGPPGFWEVLDGIRQTGMLLQRLTEDLDDGAPIASVISRTDLRSVVLNCRHYYPLGPTLLARELKRLQREGPVAPTREWSCYSAPLYVDPRPMEVATLGARLASRALHAALRRISKVSQAGLSCTFRSDRDGAPHGTLYRSRALLPPAGAQWLDPIAGAYGDKRFILLSQKTMNQPAYLALQLVDGKSVRTPGVPVYAETLGDARSPAPFTWRDTPYIYLTVEGEPGVRLLRCLQWPATWEMTGSILTEFGARSVSIAEIDQTWWLFVGTRAASEGPSDSLYLFHATSPLGPWTPHAQNPVALGGVGVCPAGPPFQFAGHWYRPARDETAAAGSCVAFMRIERLDPDVFREARVGHLTPSARLNMADVTSVSATEGLTVFGTTRTAWKMPWGPRLPQVNA